MKDIESNIVNELIKVGLNKYEAMVYMALLQTPKITAYEAGRKSGVPQSKIYDTVKELVNKRIVTMDCIAPIRYVAVPLEEFLNRYKNKTEDTINYLRENIKNINNAKTIDYIQHFYGKNQTNYKIKSMIESSKRSIYLDIWADDYEDWYEKLLEAHSRGVDIVSVVYGKINNEIGKVYYHEMHSMEKDAHQNGRWFSLVVDYSEFLFSISKGNESSSVWTKNESFTLITKCLITHDIYISEIYLKYKNILDKEFGYNLEKLRQKLHIG